MPKKRFPLGPSSTVDLEWRGMWKDFTVRVDGRELGRMQGQKEVARGGSWQLEDGSTLQVKLETGFGGGGLNVLRNGVPLPGSAADPKTAMKSAAGIVFFIAGLNLVLGLVAELGRVEFLLALGLGWIAVAVGVVFGALGFATLRGSVVALWIAIVLFAIDGLLGVFAAMEAGGTPPMGGIVFRVFIIVAMVKAAISAKASSSA
ncbi:hypothetical protein [Paraliomyxa miuraensis]|uniref:hypothetical protein n=1 Tax=Paraliomyxa miuraensis TaxID=376150 RepID=UPI002256316B|nr:hypothetical protein [Paraliomyxa miuraensis]MCX4240330.1 hypothetical protein [Paraliomyxa miuraensis]